MDNPSDLKYTPTHEWLRDHGDGTATVSPTLGRPVMLAWVHTGAASGPLRAVVRDRRPAVTPAPLPFVPKRYRR